MNFKKIGLYTTGAVAFLVIGVTTAPYLFKSPIEKAVKEVVKEFIVTPVAFDNLNISFFNNFPNLTVSLDNLSVKAPESFENTKTLETKSLALGIDLLSLFSDQIKFDKLFLQDAKINVLTDSLGISTLEIFKPSDDTKPSSSSFNLALKKVNIANSHVVFSDATSKIKIETKKTSIEGDVEVTDAFVNFDTKADIQSVLFVLENSVLVDNKPLKGIVKSKVNLNPIAIEFKENKLELAQLPLVILGKIAMLDNGVDFDFHVSSKNASLQNLFSLVPADYQKWYDGMTFKGNSTINFVLKGIMDDSGLKPDLNIDVAIQNGEIAAKQYFAHPIKNLNTKIALDLPKLNPDSLTINLPDFNFNLDKGFAKGNALYKFPMYVDSKVQANLNVTQLTQTLALSGIDLKGDVVLDGGVKGSYVTKEYTTKSGVKTSAIVEVPTFDVKANWSNGYFKWKEMPLAIDKFAFNLQAKNATTNYKNTNVNFTNVALNAGQNYVKGKLQVDNLVNFNTNTNLDAYVNLADVKKIIPINEVDFGGELFVNTKAVGKLDLDKGKIPVSNVVVKLKNGYLLYKNLPELPLEKVNLETHISSPKGSLNDLNVKVLPISFLLANEPFMLDANLFNFNNLTFDIGTKGNLNLGNLYKLFAIDGLSVDGKFIADLKLKGKGGADNPSSLNNRGYVLLKDIKIKSEFFPHEFVFSDGKFRFFKNKMRLDNIKMTYAKQQFVVNGELENYINYFLTNKATLKGNLNVASNFIDVNSFMFNTTASASNSTSNSGSGVVLLPDHLSFELNADAKKVKFNDLLLKNLKGVLEIYDQKLKLHEAKFGLIDTEFTLNGSYAPINAKKALFDFDINAMNFDIQKAYKELALFREMAPAAENASGQVSLKYQLNGSLNKEMFPNMKSIKGSGDLILENIQFNGFKLFNQVAKETKTDALHDANVKNVTVKTSIANNVMTIERTKFKIAGFRPRVEGQVTLDGTMNIGMRLGLPPFGIIGIPISITGNSDDFKIKLSKYKEENLEEDDEDYEEYKKTIETTQPTIN